MERGEVVFVSSPLFSKVQFGQLCLIAKPDKTVLVGNWGFSYWGRIACPRGAKSRPLFFPPLEAIEAVKAESIK